MDEVLVRQTRMDGVDEGEIVDEVDDTPRLSAVQVDSAQLLS